MPEEINRIVADHVSDLLFCPSATAAQNLAAEGIATNVHVVGDVMLDILNWAIPRLSRKPENLERLGVPRQRYLLVTVHRSENTDDPARLSNIVEALNAINEPIVFPVHPRTRKAIAETGRPLHSKIGVIDPVGYLDMVGLSRDARLILTDSGGLQKEAYWLGVPCVTLRDDTEWIETVEAGWNTLTGCAPDAIVRAVRSFAPPAARPTLYGDGFAAVKCVDLFDTALRGTSLCTAAAVLS
jgi:UDP-N-acetylglucosamine 2-epimerase